MRGIAGASPRYHPAMAEPQSSPTAVTPIPLPDDAERESIWTIHLGLRKQDSKKFDLGKIVSASDGFSGSEIEQAVVAALYRALHQKTSLTTDLLIEELTHTVPLSVTRREDIDALRQTAEGRFVNVR